MKLGLVILLGLAAGSFVNALVWRLQQSSLPSKKRKALLKDLSILKGRSMCVHCRHKLKAIDLIPVLSWLGLRGRCRYCNESISWQYPLVEASVAFLYGLSYLHWPFGFDALGTILFAIWLPVLAGLTALFIFDVRWMLLPNKIIFPLYGLAILWILVRLLNEASINTFLEIIGAIFIGGGIFYILFQISKGSWIGGGDVKLGFLLGALAYSPSNALLVLFFASIAGTFITLPLLFSGKVSRKARIPFGPFLIAAGILVVLYGDRLSDWYFEHLILA